MDKFLYSFLPKTSLTLIKSNRNYLIKKGCILFADVAGFTPLTEALMILGKEGSEELTRILNNYFEEMIKIVEEYNGDILRFAGDAITILFNQDKGETALYCGLKMIEKMNDFKKIKTRAGVFTLEMKIGCAFGETQIGILHDGKEIDYYAFGEPLNLSAEAEHLAQRGCLICSSNVSVPNELKKELCCDGFFIISGIPKASPKRNKEKNFFVDLNSVLYKLLPKYLIEKSDPKTSGEHRGITVIFISFEVSKKNNETIHKEILDFYIKLKKVVSKYGGIINKFDFGDKGSKALLLFGTPYFLESKEKMALRCALEIKESFKKQLPIKMGITSSHLFSGPIGSTERKEFTVMGDGINLAARLMGYLKDSTVSEKDKNHNQLPQEKIIEIITDENTFKAAKDEIEFVERGKIPVKGKSGLIPIFEPIRIKEDTAKETKTLYGFDDIKEELIEWLKSEEREPVLITSDIGGGKSSLAQWLYNQAKLREYRTLKIDLHPFTRELFFSFFSRIIKELFKIKSEESIKSLSSILPEKLQEFVELLNPYLGYRETENPSFKNLSPKDKRDIIFTILISLISKIEKTVIVVDNLSFADETSIQFFSQYLTQSKNKTLDFVVFSRKEILKEQIANYLVKRIELPSFNAENVKEFLEKEYCLINVTEKILNFFLEKSKGNPQLLSAIYDAAQKENLVVEKEGIKFIDENRLFKTTFPDSLEAIYLKEFDQLKKREKDFLFSSSVLGINVSVNLLKKISDFTENEIEELSRKLEKRNFIKIDNSGIRKYLQFTDILLNQAIYNLAPFSFKRVIHKKVFEEIYKLEGELKPSVFPYLAYHAEKAEDKDNAIKFHRLSAKMFSERYDYISALRHYEYVINNDSIKEEYFNDALKLLDIYLTLGNFENFEKLLLHLKSNSSKMSNTNLATLYSKISVLDIRNGKIKEAEEHLNYSLKLAEKTGGLYEIASALLNLAGRVFGPSGRYEDAKKHLYRILSLPRFENDTFFKVNALMNLGLIFRFNNDYLNAKKYYLKALNISKKNKLVLREAAIYSNLSNLYYLKNDFYKAMKYAKVGISNSTTFSQKELSIDLLMQNSLCLWATGNLKDARTIAEEILISAKLSKKIYVEGVLLSILAATKFEQYLINESLEDINRSIRIFEDIGSPAEEYSSKLEYLRFLKFLGNEYTFKKTIEKWGGKDLLTLKAKKYNLPLSLRAIVEKNPLKEISSLDEESPASSIVLDKLRPFDADAFFVFWYDFQDEKFLHIWRKELFLAKRFLRWDLKVKWCWAYLLKELDPPFNPTKLLTKFNGGFFGLKILAILYRQALKKRNLSKAERLRKRFLDAIYQIQIHSNRNILRCIFDDENLTFALKGK